MTDYPRTPEEILAIQKDRMKAGAETLDNLLVWEMMTAMWITIKPLSEHIATLASLSGDMAFVIRVIKLSMKAIGLVGGAAAVGSAVVGFGLLAGVL